MNESLEDKKKERVGEKTEGKGAQYQKRGIYATRGLVYRKWKRKKKC